MHRHTFFLKHLQDFLALATNLILSLVAIGEYTERIEFAYIVLITITSLGRGQKFNFMNMVMWHVKL